MGLLQRMKILWLGFWNRALGDHEQQHPDLLAEGVLTSHRKHLQRIRRALTTLIFQRKRIGDQLAKLDAEILEIKRDLQIAAKEDRDELAVNLIAKLDTLQEQQRFLTSQLESLEEDAKHAEQTEKDLMAEISKAEMLTATLKSRHTALRVRRQMREELQHVGSNLARLTSSNASGAIQDQIRRMEAEIESLGSKQEDWEKEWRTVRKTRMANRHRDVLDKIKRNLRTDEFALPGTTAASPS